MLLKKLSYDVFTTLLVEIEETLNNRPMTYLSYEYNDQAITRFHLLFGRNISKQNLIHIDYRGCTAKNTEQQQKRVKFIINHCNNRFYEEYILALRERHQYDVRKFNNGRNFRSSHPELFLSKGVLKICSKFTGKHPCRSAISIKSHNRTSTQVFSCKFAAYFQDTFSEKHL